MHESSMIKNILEEAQRAASANGSTAVTKLTVELSEFGGFDEHHFRYHFDAETKGTPWQDVALEIKKIPYGQEARLVSITLSEEGTYGAQNAQKT